MINVICYEQLTSSKTKLIQEKVTVKEGVLDLTNHPDLFFVGVFNRYPNQNSFALAVVKGFGITQGAWASTVSHDSHNLTVVYRDVIDAQLVIQRVIDMQGGMASAHHHHLTGDLALPIAGLLSLKPANHLAKDIEAMKHAIRDLGLNSNNPLLRITTLALPVIPGFKMSDRGIIDVLKQDFIPLFAN